MSTTPIRAADARAVPGFREFVGLVAALMAINALGIDTMLPALPAMGAALGIAEENQRQWIIAAYVFGFGACQLLWGPLIDRYGRRPILTIALVFFAIASIACTFATSFETIVAARLLQGVGAAASRVLATALVRDRFEGRAMARVMSLTFLVFLAVPILAPSIGQLVLLVAPWQGIFFGLAAFGLIVVAWAGLRLPETLRPEHRRAISPSQIVSAIRVTLSDRTSIGYTLAMTLMFGSMMGFINSAQQIFVGVFGLVDLFPIAFAACAGSMAVGSIVNARIVERIGTRRVSQGAVLAVIVIAGVHSLVTLSGHETLATFLMFQAVTMAFVPLATSNFGAMAMEPVGHIAGTAAAVQGTISTVGGALFGLIVGQNFNGSTVPLTLGFFVLATLSLGMVLWTERGRLFRPHHASAQA